MPLRNRVGPDGEIFATPARGTLMGNRGGAIHNDRREIVRPYASRRWIACVLEFRGRHREVMSPGRYTELFFLDEAVALAAGHRPCAECRRERFNAFKAAWARSHGLDAGTFVYADAIDEELHGARFSRPGGKVTWEGRLESMPDGAFIRMDGANWLVWGDRLLRWSPEGYVERRERCENARVEVLTPQPIAGVLKHGYTPGTHWTRARE